MSSLQPSVDEAGRAWISAKALQFVLRECKGGFPNETGGILLGYWSEVPPQPVVTYATGPGPKAIHALDRFVPDHEYHVTEAARLYSQSRRRIGYLGDWHSHPGTSGHLSIKDRDTLITIATCREARAERPLMLILAQEYEWLPVMWSIRQSKRRRLSHLYVVERWNVETFEGE